jgi:S1-C subfamily serine protease
MSRFWRHFISNGQDGLVGGYLGLNGYGVALAPPLAERHGLAGGVEVRAVDPGSPAEAAGVLEQDVIVSLAEQATPSADELHRLLTRLPVDVPLPIRWLRGERQLERWVVLSDFPSPARRR